MKTVLFVAYGSGHIKMVVPVAQALATSGCAHPVVLALTTAAPVARAAGLDVVQFKDFVGPGDEVALGYGRSLMARLESPVADTDETVAYLGLSFFDLVQSMGARHAEADYRRRGRQAFLPVPTLKRILQRVRPDLVVATNSPRAERAAIVASRQLELPSVCMVDLFAIDEVQWIGAPDYADRVCVLNESVRQFLIQAGRQAAQVVVTGNPGFDVLQSPSVRDRGGELRRSCGWTDKKVILWPNQVEPTVHPFDGRPGHPDLPARVLAELLGWVRSREDVVLCIRARAGEGPADVPIDPRIVLAGQDWPLGPLLHAVDLVVTLNSTVGLEGRLAGCRLIQVLGSVFDHAMPLARFGIADEAVSLNGVRSALDRWIGASRHAVIEGPLATQSVLKEVVEFL